MTDKQNSEVRATAAALETLDMGGVADLVRRQYAELETLTLYKNLADEYGLSIFPDIAEMTAELETLRAKLKTYEDLGGAGSDVQLLRMGYAAARLEIESLRKEHADELAVAYMCGASRWKELAAQQPSPAAQGDALDAARYRWLRDCNLAKFPELNRAFYLGNKNLDTAIDAARAAQEGKSNG